MHFLLILPGQAITNRGVCLNRGRSQIKTVVRADDMHRDVANVWHTERMKASVREMTLSSNRIYTNINHLSSIIFLYGKIYEFYESTKRDK